jgi:hypothetical protein
MTMTAKSLVSGMTTMAALLMSAIAPLHATPLPGEGVFVYSSLCRERESGDAAGYRIVLFHSPGRDNLSLEWSEGPLYGPTLAGNVKFDSQTSKLTFTIPQAGVPPGDPAQDFYEAEISSESITLTDVNTVNRRAHLIPRVQGFGRMGPC